jgi:hypothetical protein
VCVCVSACIRARACACARGRQGRVEGTQDVVLEVPGFLAAQLGASRGWDIPARLRWKLSRETAAGPWLADSVALVPPSQVSS